MKRRDALIYGRTTEHRRRVDKARELVTLALAAATSWYVAFSAGKDSTCVLHLVREQEPSTPAQFSARKWDLPETRDLIRRTPDARVIAYRGFDGTDWLPSWRDESEAREQHPETAWLDKRDEIAIRGAAEAGVFLGLRAEENGYRRRHLQRFGPLFRCAATTKWHANPIAAWSVLDVWAYILAADLDYNRAYDVMEGLGMNLHRQRIGPFGRALEAGSLATLKRGWPAEFNRLAAEHPEARLYA